MRSPVPVCTFLLLLVGTVGTVAGCGEARPDRESDDTVETGDLPPPMSIVLIDQTKWMMVDEATDPLVDHRPENPFCGPDGTLLHETGTFDVIMDQCSYFMGVQPILADIQAGDCVEIPFFHGDLISPQGAFSHVAVLLDGQTIWEVRPPIPSPVTVAYGYWTAPESFPQGTPVHYHVHNHGPNTYVLGDIAILPRESSQSCPPVGS